MDDGLLQDILSWASDDEGHMPEGLADVLEPYLDPTSARLTYEEMESERDRLAYEIYRIGTRIENDLADYRPEHDFRRRGLEHALEVIREETETKVDE